MEAYTSFVKTQIIEEMKTQLKESKEKNLGAISKILDGIFSDEKVSKVLVVAFETPKASTTVTTVSKTKKGEDKVKSPNWQSIWISKDRGGRQMFPKDYDELKKELGEKTSHFVIMSHLRTRKEKDGGWVKWYKGLLKKGENVPKDPPSDRKPKEEKKPSKEDDSKSTEDSKSTKDDNDSVIDDDAEDAGDDR